MPKVMTNPSSVPHGFAVVESDLIEHRIAFEGRKPCSPPNVIEPPEKGLFIAGFWRPWRKRNVPRRMRLDVDEDGSLEYR